MILVHYKQANNQMLININDSIAILPKLLFFL